MKKLLLIAFVCLCVNAQAQTPLASLANSMQPGSWAELQTSNIGVFNQGGAAGNILDYASDASWDPIHRKFLYYGSDHIDANPALISRLVVYDDATNSWTNLGPGPFATVGQTEHGFYNHAIDPATGTFYRRYAGAQYYKYDVASNVWTSLPGNGTSLCPNCIIQGSDFAAAFGGYIYAQGGENPTGSVYLFNTSTQQWSRIAQNITALQSYPTFSAYSPLTQTFIFGNHNGGFYKMNSSFAVTQLTTPPISIYTGSGFLGNLVADPITGNFVVLAADTRALYQFVAGTDTWQALASANKPNLAFWDVISAPISNYGVTMYVACAGATCKTYLYKYAASAPPPAAQCSDSIDNDADGLIDYPSDPGCANAGDNDETNVVNPPPAGQPISWWKFDEGSGTAAADSAGLNNGTLSGAPTWVTGKISQAIQLNGSTQYATLAAATSLQPPFTWTAWVNVPPAVAVGTILGGSGGNPQFRVESDRRLGLINQQTALVAYSTGTVGTGFVHVAVSYDALGRYVFYINGAASGSGTNLVSFSSGATTIGGRADTAERFTGIIDDLRVYNRELTAAEVLALFNMTAPPPSDTTAPSTPTNLAGTPFTAQINLTWTASTDAVGVAAYHLERCTGAACSNFIEIAAPVNASYSNTGLAASTSYSYRVRAADAAGNISGYSTTATIVTLAGTPPPTGVVQSFQITSAASSATLPFTVGLAFKQGDIPGTPVMDVTDQQVIVKKRWNDGSVKHAIASGQAVVTLNVAKTINVSNGSPAGGTALTSASITTANPQASVQLGSIGTVNLSSLLATPFRTWISGPEMVEAHYQAAVGSDPTLTAWFHVRLYKAGRVWIRISVENGFLDVATGDKSYVPTVMIGGVTVYTNGGAALAHYAHTRWTVEGWVGGDPQITPTFDTTYLMASKMVPNYWKRRPSAAALNALYQSYAPMQSGGWTIGMSDTGYQDQIGLLPLWDALYITSGDARAYRSVIANSKTLGSYPIVWTDSATRLPPLPSNRPTWSVYGDSQGGATAWGAGPLTWDVAHHGSGGYLAYLLTGDYFHLETMEHQSSLCYLIGTYAWGQGTARIYQGQTRAVAWCQRTWGQLAGIGPSDTVTNDYRTLLANNASHWKNVADAPGANLLGYLFAYEMDQGGISVWQQHFWIQSYGHVSDLEPFADMSAWNAGRNHLYKAAVGILGPGGTGGYCFTDASIYTLKVASGTEYDPVNYFDNWEQVHTATFGSSPPCGNTLGGSSGGDPALAFGYWGNLLPAIAYAVEHGASGAAAAWNRLTGASNWSTFENSGFDNVPIWGIVPRSTVTVPPPPTGDTTPPTITFITPNKSSFTTDDISVRVAPRDNIRVVRVELFRAGQLKPIVINEEAQLPLTTYLRWQAISIPLGSYVLNAYAYDAAGNKSVQPATITIVRK